MKTTIELHRTQRVLSAGVAALLLALASVAGAQTNTGTGPSPGPQSVVNTNGTSALTGITTGTDNTAYGNLALKADTTGIRNTALGSLALTTNALGNYNTAVGYGALRVNTASANTALGHGALYANTSGSANTALGFGALFTNNTGLNGVAIGHSALYANTTGNFNTALGVQALRLNTTGASNVAIGYQALYHNVTGSMNTAIGDGALLNGTGAGNIALGEDAGVNLTTGSNDIYIGNPGGVAGGGIATESGIIRIGYTKSGAVGFHTATYLAGIIHGNGSGLSGITGASLTAGSITSTQLATGAVTGAKIANGAIASTKLAAGAAAANLNASGQSGVASGGLVLSATENNAALVSAGYIKIGATTMSDTWLTRDTLPGARGGHTAVWTGSEMIVWGGLGGSYLNDGGRYNPAGNSWTATSNVLPNPAPAGRAFHTAVWTGSEMIVWGGYNGISYLNSGGRYNPAGDGWTATSNVLPNPAPAGRDGHTAVWTGSEMIVWGGYNGSSSLNDGGRYNPAGNSWAAIPNTLPNTPAAGNYRTAVWTGSEVIVWGGYNGSSHLNDGGRYNPAGNSWAAIPNTLPNTPAARWQHTAVWTGSEMIVWGGYNRSYLNDGGRYNPAGNSWTAIPNTLPNTPAARDYHTAVWTGSEMIVWGGYNGSSFLFLNDGGRYNPAGNSWTAIPNTMPNTPAARGHHKAVWTGSEMIVWGGYNDSSLLNDTSSYTPGRVMFLYQRP